MSSRRLTAIALTILVIASSGTVVAVDTTGLTASDDQSLDTLEIHHINAGQGDAILLIGSDETMLIDSGYWQDRGRTVLAYLEDQDVDRIDHLVATHPHADHIGGHDEIIEAYECDPGKDGIGTVYDTGTEHGSQTYQRYQDAISEYDIERINAEEGMTIPFNGTDTRILNPAQNETSSDLHRNSLTLHITHGTNSALVTGDAERPTEQRLVDDYGDQLEADIYQVGHHGSSTSSSADFVEAVDPQYSVLSASYTNQYDFPHREALRTLDAQGTTFYWTATHGDVVFESDGEDWIVDPEHDAETDCGLLCEPAVPALVGNADISSSEAVIRGTIAAVASP